MPAKAFLERVKWFEQQVMHNGYPNKKKLAEKFEMSEKTAQRDIDFLIDRLGCPLLKNEMGYYFEQDTHWTIQSVYLSSEELTAVLIARQLLSGISGIERSPSGRTGFVDHELSSIVDKLTNVIRGRSSVPDVIDQVLSVQTIECSLTPDNIFKNILGAILSQNCIQFKYYSPSKGEETSRLAEPYHLLNYMGTWHLFAYCRDRRAIRNFVVARMNEVSVSDTKFHGHKGFENFTSIRDYISGTFGIFKGVPVYNVALRFTPFKAQWIKYQIWHKNQELTENADGSINLVFPAANLLEVKMEILKHGADVEVLSPPELKQMIRKEIEKMAKFY
jgi:predicted DNA-binding transcriptional regulator YafY